MTTISKEGEVSLHAVASDHPVQHIEVSQYHTSCVARAGTGQARRGDFHLRLLAIRLASNLIVYQL